MDRAHDLILELGTDLADASDSDEAMDRLVAIVTGRVGTPHGGVTIVRGGGRRFVTHGATNQLVEQADHLQYDLGEGPCLDAATSDDDSVLSSDLARDERWPRWGPEAHGLGFGSVLSTELRARGQRIGAINLYGEVGRVFDDDDRELARVGAVVGAAVLGFAREAQTLATALETRSDIGRAQGILMEVYGIDADRAFAYLTRQSQNTNTRLVEVARKVVAQRGRLNDKSGEI